MPDFAYRIRPSRLAMLTDGPSLEEIVATQAHFAYLQAAESEGRVLLAGRTLTKDPRTFGIVIFRADDLAAAQAFVDEDPAVATGVMNAELFPFRVALHAKSWEPEPDA